MAGLRVPLSTLRRWPYDHRRMTRGPDDWLGLSGVTLSSTTPCRFGTGALVLLPWYDGATGAPPAASCRPRRDTMTAKKKRTSSDPVPVAKKKRSAKPPAPPTSEPKSTPAAAAPAAAAKLSALDAAARVLRE